MLESSTLRPASCVRVVTVATAFVSRDALPLDGCVIGTQDDIVWACVVGFGMVAAEYATLQPLKRVDGPWVAYVWMRMVPWGSDAP